METDKQKQITTIMKKSTNNYERPEVQVVHVETEAGFAVTGSEGYGIPGAPGASGEHIDDEDY